MKKLSAYFPICYGNRLNRYALCQNTLGTFFSCPKNGTRHEKKVTYTICITV